MIPHGIFKARIRPLKWPVWALLRGGIVVPITVPNSLSRQGENSI
jgi:hypothetical protein